MQFSLDGKTTFKPIKIILVIGEWPYAEGMGDLITFQPKEMNELSSLISYWLPATMGSAIADLLVGLDAFSGKFPFSWSVSKDQINDDYSNKYNVWQFPLGFGLNLTCQSPPFVTQNIC